MINRSITNKILLSALAANIDFGQRKQIVSALAKRPEALAVAQALGSSKLIRELRLSHKPETDESWLAVEQDDKGQVLYKGQTIGKIQILYKSPLPGELQARLAIESTIDRFLEYLQKLHQIVVLDESDRHVSLFIPNKPIPNFSALWQEFLEQVAFSAYGDVTNKLPGLIQTFILIFNAVSFAGRGASTLDVPILTQDQADILVALYFAVVRDVEKRQVERQKQIDQLNKDLLSTDLNEKDRISKEKKMTEKLAKQVEENLKYTENFQRVFCKILTENNSIWQQIELLESELVQPKTTKSKKDKIQKQISDLKGKTIFEKDSVQRKLMLLDESKGDPFQFIRLDQQQEPEKFSRIAAISKNFTKTATDQINSRGNIFSKVVLELYRLLEGMRCTPLSRQF